MTYQDSHSHSHSHSPALALPGEGATLDSTSGDGSPTAVLLVLAWLAAANTRSSLLAIGPLLPLAIADLHLSATVAGALSGLPLLLMGAISIPAGLLADRIGPRRLLVAALLGLGLAGGVRGMAESAAVLVAASVGLGAAIGLGQPALPQVARTVSRRWAGLATAVYTNGLMLGAMSGVMLTLPVLLPLAGSWRNVLLLWGLGSLVAALGWALAAMPRRPAPRPGMAATLPLRQVLAIPGLLPVAIVFASQGAIFYALSTWLAPYYVAQGRPLSEASTALAALTLTAIFGGTIAPGIALWWGSVRRTLVAAGVVTALAQVALVLLPGQEVLWVGVTSFATSFALTLGLAAPAQLAPREKVGAAAGLLLALGYLGSMLGPLGFGVLRDLTGGFTASLVFLVAIGVTLSVAAAAIPKR
ncbi:MAG: MFS transporter [Chloroflexi bacterium]|nr:MFS transporter [Chloroflexota bacterium]